MVTTTKQDTLKEGLHKIFYINNLGGVGECIAYNDIILKYLHDNDVVRKVKRELPKVFIGKQMSEDDGMYKQSVWEMSQDAMLKVGYNTATEPLI